MPKLKIVADLLTSYRAFIPLALIWLGASQAAAGLELAVFLMLSSWISDYFDGLLARKSQLADSTWIGNHDLQIDVLVGTGLLAYLGFSGFLSWGLAAIYSASWALFFLFRGIAKSYGALYQGLIYIYFVWLAWQYAPATMLYVGVLLFGIIVFSWRRLLDILIPEFFAGLRGFGKAKTPKAS